MHRKLCKQREYVIEEELTVTDLKHRVELLFRTEDSRLGCTYTRGAVKQRTHLRNLEWNDLYVCVRDWYTRPEAHTHTVA